MHYVAPYDTICRKLAAVAQGHNTKANNRRDPKNIRGEYALWPAEVASTAATPNRRIGIVNGIMSKEIRTPDRLDPKTKAAPMAPKRLIIGVPRAMLPSKLK
jgi:hypothetical protein